jgi:hypothetical protein
VSKTKPVTERVINLCGGVRKCCPVAHIKGDEALLEEDGQKIKISKDQVFRLYEVFFLQK